MDRQCTKVRLKLVQCVVEDAAPIVDHKITLPISDHLVFRSHYEKSSNRRLQRPEGVNASCDAGSPARPSCSRRSVTRRGTRRAWSCGWSGPALGSRSGGVWELLFAADDRRQPVSLRRAPKVPVERRCRSLMLKSSRQTTPSSGGRRERMRAQFLRPGSPPTRKGIV
jgi:hypothetical protein